MMEQFHSTRHLVVLPNNKQMRIPIYSKVELLTDKYLNNGVEKGNTGAVIEIYDDGYEVEFIDKKGNTLAVFGVEPEEIRIIKSEDK